MSKTLLPLLYVGAGGFVGAVLRYLLTIALTPASPAFPYGTLAVNLIGCFAIGALAPLAVEHALLSNAARLFLLTGICGGFTTLSAVVYEGDYLFRQVDSLTVGLYIGLTLIGGAACFYLGHLVIRLAYRS